jgi:hypothetical protein
MGLIAGMGEIAVMKMDRRSFEVLTNPQSCCTHHFPIVAWES